MFRRPSHRILRSDIVACAYRSWLSELDLMAYVALEQRKSWIDSLGSKMQPLSKSSSASHHLGF